MCPKEPCETNCDQTTARRTVFCDDWREGEDEVAERGARERKRAARKVQKCIPLHAGAGVRNIATGFPFFASRFSSTRRLVVARRRALAFPPSFCSFSSFVSRCLTRHLQAEGTKKAKREIIRNCSRLLRFCFKRFTSFSVSDRLL